MYTHLLGSQNEKVKSKNKRIEPFDNDDQHFRKYKLKNTN